MYSRRASHIGMNWGRRGSQFGTRSSYLSACRSRLKILLLKVDAPSSSTNCNSIHTRLRSITSTSEKRKIYLKANLRNDQIFPRIPKRMQDLGQYSDKKPLVSIYSTGKNCWRPVRTRMSHKQQISLQKLSLASRPVKSEKIFNLTDSARCQLTSHFSKYQSILQRLNGEINSSISLRD